MTNISESSFIYKIGHTSTRMTHQSNYQESRVGLILNISDDSILKQHITSSRASQTQWSNFSCCAQPGLSQPQLCAHNRVYLLHGSQQPLIYHYGS
ncbi:hypothetical protein ACFX2J_028286 [Malus domestica]